MTAGPELCKSILSIISLLAEDGRKEEIRTIHVKSNYRPDRPNTPLTGSEEAFWTSFAWVFGEEGRAFTKGVMRSRHLIQVEGEPCWAYENVKFVYGHKPGQEVHCNLIFTNSHIVGDWLCAILDKSGNVLW